MSSDDRDDDDHEETNSDKLNKTDTTDAMSDKALPSLDGKLSELNDTLSRLRKESEDQIQKLRRESEDATKTIQRLQMQLKQQSDYETLKREIQ